MTWSHPTSVAPHFSTLQLIVRVRVALNECYFCWMLVKTNQKCSLCCPRTPQKGNSSNTWSLKKEVSRKRLFRKRKNICESIRVSTCTKLKEEVSKEESLRTSSISRVTISESSAYSSSQIYNDQTHRTITMSTYSHCHDHQYFYVSFKSQIWDF